MCFSYRHIFAFILQHKNNRTKKKEYLIIFLVIYLIIKKRAQTLLCLVYLLGYRQVALPSTSKNEFTPYGANFHTACSRWWMFGGIQEIENKSREVLYYFNVSTIYIGKSFVLWMAYLALNYYFYESASFVFNRWQQTRSFSFIETEGNKVACLMLF